MNSEIDNLQLTVEFLRAKGFRDARMGIILGSGLGGLADKLEDSLGVDYGDIPGFPAASVAGHAGRLVQGSLAGVRVLAMQGRYHYYEGHPQRQLAWAVWTMVKLGVETLVVTNAAGGLDPSFNVGDLMLITDHINFTGDSPLRGPNLTELGPRFPDMSRAYDQDLAQLARNVATGMNLRLQEGVYLAVSGPSYESPGEINAFARLGASAVGMSTVPEVTAAVHCGLRVLGISCITNMAAGLGHATLSHAEVIETTNRVRLQFETLVTNMVKAYREEYIK